MAGGGALGPEKYRCVRPDSQTPYPLPFALLKDSLNNSGQTQDKPSYRGPPFQDLTPALNEPESDNKPYHVFVRAVKTVIRTVIRK